MISIATITLIHALETSCPTKLAQITTEPATQDPYLPKDALLNEYCTKDIGSILEREAGHTKKSLGPVTYLYLQHSLDMLSRHCIDSDRRTTPTFADVYKLGVSIDRKLGDSSVDTIVSADRRIDTRMYASGFAAFASLVTQYNYNLIETLSVKGQSAYLNGLDLGKRARFSLAKASFRAAHNYASADYPFQDALYFLGVTEIALGERDKARKTFCYALPLTYRRPGDTEPSLVWNFLIANRLARL